MKLVSLAQMEAMLLPALEFLRSLVAENSYTANLPGIARNADLIAAQFAELGFSSEQVPARDPQFGRHLFLERRGRGGPGLLLVTHLDTVFPPEEETRNNFAWLPDGERIYGPGVIDNKGGTAMIWLVLAALRVAEPEFFERTHWVIAANAAEEELAPDFPVLCRERLPSDCRAALVFEACSGQGPGYSLVRRRKGSANLRITAEGRGAHAGSRHHEGANAIAQLSHLVQRIEALTDYDRKLTANVGRFVGGGPTNRVPHEAFCEVNLRAFEEPVLQEAVAAIQAMAEEAPAVRAASDGYPCRVTVETLSRNPAWPGGAATDDLIDDWMKAASALGIPLTSEERGGLSDGNYLSQFLPVLDGLGPFGRNGHASERSADGSKVPEFVLPFSFVDMGAVHATAILRLLGE